MFQDQDGDINSTNNVQLNNKSHMAQGLTYLLYEHKPATSDVVLEARPWPRGASRPNFMAIGLEGPGLGLGLGLESPGLGLDLGLEG